MPSNILKKSVKILQTNLDCRDEEEEGGSGTNSHRKCIADKDPGIFAKNCLSIFAIISTIVIIILTTLLVVDKNKKSAAEHHLYTACPDTWIGLGTKCFYFSEDTRDWTLSQDFCDSYEANLVQIETLEELNFLKRYKGSFDHWIGLSRESSNHTWKWTDSTKYNFLFPVRGAGECAYLNDHGVSSGMSYIDRRWICSKPNSRISRCQITSDFKQI